jgi:hypothetical protein
VEGINMKVLVHGGPGNKSLQERAKPMIQKPWEAAVTSHIEGYDVFSLAAANEAPLKVIINVGD